MSANALTRRAWMAVALLALPISASAAVAPYSAQYEVRRNGEPLGTAMVEYRALGGGRFELTSKTIGSEGLAAIAGAAVDEHSIVRWTGSRPETIRYDYRQKLAWKTRERSLQVDAAGRRIDSRDKDRRYSPPYQPGVLDRNAITVALMNDVASGQSGDLRYQVPDHEELETHVYRVAAPERLQTALGAQPVVRVERIRASANGRTTTLWLGSDKRFVPLRMLQREPDGETIEMRITSLR